MDKIKAAHTEKHKEYPRDLELFNILLEADTEFNKRMHIVAEAQRRYESNKYDKATAYNILKRLNVLALKKSRAGQKFFRNRTASDTAKEYGSEIFDLIFAIFIGSAAFLPFMEKAATLASSNEGKLGLGIPAGFATALLYAMQAARFREVLWEAVSACYEDPSNLWKLIVHLVMNYYASTSVEGVATIAFNREDRILKSMGLGESTDATMRTLTALDIEVARLGAGVVNTNSCVRETKELQRKIHGVEGFVAWLRTQDLNSALSVYEDKEAKIDRRTKLGTLFPAYGKADMTPPATPPNYGSMGRRSSTPSSSLVTPTSSAGPRFNSYQNSDRKDEKDDARAVTFHRAEDPVQAQAAQPQSSLKFPRVSFSNTHTLTLSQDTFFRSPSPSPSPVSSAEGKLKSALKKDKILSTSSSTDSDLSSKKKGEGRFGNSSPHVHQNQSGVVTAISEPGAVSNAPAPKKVSASPGKSYGSLGS
jgi:hypothetical protein